MTAIAIGENSGVTMALNLTLSFRIGKKFTPNTSTTGVETPCSPKLNFQYSAPSTV
jgi:hypothetical protein